jgi:cytochrome c-type biogenesis protein CcmE
LAKKTKKTSWIVGGSVIAAAVVGMSFLNLSENLVYFYTPSEAFAKAPALAAKNIKVGGMVMDGTVNFDAEKLGLTFTMTDFKGHDIAVSHRGVPPDMFKEGQGVVVEGRLSEDGKQMTSRNLMVKHSEEYKTPDAQHSVDRELLEKSLFKE